MLFAEIALENSIAPKTSGKGPKGKVIMNV